MIKVADVIGSVDNVETGEDNHDETDDDGDDVDSNVDSSKDHRSGHLVCCDQPYHTLAISRDLHDLGFYTCCFNGDC